MSIQGCSDDEMILTKKTLHSNPIFIKKKGGGALNPQTPPGSLRLIWAPPPPPPIPPPPLCSDCETTRGCGAFLYYIGLHTYRVHNATYWPDRLSITRHIIGGAICLCGYTLGKPREEHQHDIRIPTSTALVGWSGFTVLHTTKHQTLCSKSHNTTINNPQQCSVMTHHAMRCVGALYCEIDKLLMGNSSANTTDNAIMIPR
jgi:hypothetical protein